MTGSPVTTTGTLALGWKVAPTNANTANAIVKRDASGNFSAGTIGATQLKAANVNLTGQLGIASVDTIAISVDSNSTVATTTLSSAPASSGPAWGVEGITGSSASSAYGVIGVASASTGDPIGVYGLASNSPFGIGVFGQGGPESTTGSSTAVDFTTGVWGDGGSVRGVGVLGTTDDEVAGSFMNSSTTYAALEAGAMVSGGSPLYVYNNVTGGYCGVDSGGNLNCSGTKNAVVPVDGGKRIVALSAIESPENWFEDFGSGQLVNGVAVVALDPVFIQTVNTSMDYKVFPVPTGDCKGLYVTNKTATSFEVRELGGGASNVSFDYRITALRRKYESVRFADHTHDVTRGATRPGMRTTVPRSSHNPTKQLMPMAANTAQLTTALEAAPRSSTRQEPPGAPTTVNPGGHATAPRPSMSSAVTRDR